MPDKDDIEMYVFRPREKAIRRTPLHRHGWEEVIPTNVVGRYVSYLGKRTQRGVINLHRRQALLEDLLVWGVRTPVKFRSMA